MDSIILSHTASSVHYLSPAFGCHIAFMAVATSMALYVVQFRAGSADYHSIKPYNPQWHRKILFYVLSLIAFFCFDSPDDLFSCLFPMNGVKSLKDLLNHLTNKSKRKH